LVRPLILVSCEDDGDDKVAQAHAEGTQGKDRLASDAIDVEDCWYRSYQHDYADHTSSEE